jgi:hypothetical protein
MVNRVCTCRIWYSSGSTMYITHLKLRDLYRMPVLLGRRRQWADGESDKKYINNFGGKIS